MYELEIQDLPNHVDADKVGEAVDFAVLYLGIKSNIVIIFEEFDHPNQAGNADFPDDGEAEITVNNATSELEVIATILHELVHIQQMEQGALGFCVKRRVLTWFGKAYYECNAEMTRETYYNLPWEKQAYLLEEDMMRNLIMGVAA